VVIYFVSSVIIVDKVGLNILSLKVSIRAWGAASIRHKQYVNLVC
jgi:hypothetical protein